jgi:heptosyltransferase I
VPPQSPSSILIIRPSALGDVCRSVPVLASLRRAYPEARVDWLVRDSFAPAIDQHPALTNVIPFARKSMGQGLKRAQPRELRALLTRLREPRYDLVLDCQGLFRSGYFAWQTRAPVRVGYSNARELGWIFCNRCVHVDPDLHAVDRMLALVRHAGVEPIADMRLYTSWQDRKWLQDQLGGKRYALLAPTSAWPGKRWPADRFAKVADWLLAHSMDAVAVVGGPTERDQCGPLLELAQRDPRVIDFIGRTSVGQLMSAVQSAAVVIANDSAGLHMAVGFDKPFIALYGPTDIRRVGPYKREHDVIQHITPADILDHKDEPLGRALMERISVEEVIERLSKIIAALPPG